MNAANERLSWDVHRLVRRAALVVGFGIAAYLGATLLATRGAWDLLLRDAGLRTVALETIVLVVIGVAIRNLRWIYFGRVLEWEAPPRTMTLAFVASYALTATPGKIGELIKASMLNARYRVPVSQCAGTLFVERLTDVAGVILLAVLGAFFIGFQAGAFIAIMTVLVVALIVVVRSNLRGRLLTTRHPRWSRFAEKLHRALEAASKLLNVRHLGLGVVLATISWGCEAFATYLIFRQLNISMDLATTTATYATSTLVAAASFLPGGVGGFEAVMILKATSIGATLSHAATATLILRLCSLWFVTLVGTVALAASSLRGQSPLAATVPTAL